MSRRGRGFYLIEALIALAVVLIGMTGALRLQVGLLAASAEAKAGDEAVALALSQLSRVRSVLAYSEYQALVAPGRQEVQGQLHRYLIEWTLSPNPNPDYKLIRIQVRWPAADPVRQIDLPTLVPGINVPRFARQQLQP